MLARSGAGPGADCRRMSAKPTAGFRGTPDPGGCTPDIARPERIARNCRRAGSTALDEQGSGRRARESPARHAGPALPALSQRALTTWAREQMGRPVRVRARNNTQRDETCGLEAVCVRVGRIQRVLRARVRSPSAARSPNNCSVARAEDKCTRTPRAHSWSEQD